MRRVDRVAAAQATKDKFDRQPLVWGRFDCGRMAAHIARGLGHKVRLSAFGQYSSEEGAKRALERAGFGFAGLAKAVDSYGWERVPPAAARPGDLIAFPIEGDWVALAMAVGGGRVLGLHEGSGCFRVVQPTFTAGQSAAWAWRL